MLIFGEENGGCIAELNSNFGFEYGNNSNGYYKKYNNGLLEMWGSAYINTSGVALNVQLPIPYMNRSYRIFVTPAYNTSSVPILMCSGQQISETAFHIYGRTHDGKAPSITATVWWNTIGYWKL
ncbi:gp53-like domain-containing protein [Extibacter muris]|uniref:gp53-like domain-containing protein n=1 Tax=Extibacter muris TaxID=1796622 RepID=UPI003B50098B